MNGCELCKILHNLPEEIIMTKIIPYSYNCQSVSIMSRYTIVLYYNELFRICI